MKTIKRIFIASDPFMTQEAEQHSNLRWMSDLLTNPVRQATGVTPMPLSTTDTREPGLLDRKFFFETSDIDLDPQVAQFWFDETRVTEASVTYARNFIEADDLIIGYEMSHQTKAILDRIGAHYVDMWLHPIRFMDDVLFGMNSSIDAVRRELANFNVEPNQMQLYADRIKIQMYKGWYRKEADVPENSAVFIGQMMNDKSVCLNGRFLSLLDFKERFAEIAAEHSHVYYARHPYLKSGDEEVLAFVRGLPNVTLTDLPTYRLIASPNVRTVFGLSSSVIAEAAMIGKETEYLYRPIFEFGSAKQCGNLHSNPDLYASIQQDFVSPAFWAQVLGAHFEVDQNTPEITFTDPKDKIRDMLGMYWSYGQIDKLENLRTANKPKPKIPDAVPEEPTVFNQSTAAIARLKSEIDAHDVVSFDIFDTLVERVIMHPNDLFKMIAPKAKAIVGDPEFDFVTARKEARHLARDRATGEEINLVDRYDAMAAHHGFSIETARRLYNLELEAEMSVCVARWIGKQAYEYARLQGKRVILVSDIFFDGDFIHSLLESCGYRDHDAVYLSSETGLLKATGNMFPHVLTSEGVAASDVLHVGDNPNADISQGRSHGLSVCHLPEKNLVTKSVSGLLEPVEGNSDSPIKSAVGGLIGHEFTRGALGKDAGVARGDAETLGYVGLGPMFYGFANWILQTAKTRGLTDVYFLARDGDIVQRCYEVLSANDPDAPHAHYLLASRRAVRAASIFSAEDVDATLRTNFTPSSLRYLLKHRFGLDTVHIDPQELAEYGFQSLDDLADWKANAENIRGLFLKTRIFHQILQRSRSERDELLEYFERMGLSHETDGRRIGFVDIGHSGSIQSGVCKILPLRHTTGMYFTTFADIGEKMLPGQHVAFAYYGDRLPESDREHPYKRNILMFETAFLNDQRSLVRIEGGKPVYLETASDAQRTRLARQLHFGAVQFCRDFVDRFGTIIGTPLIAPDLATAFYNRFVTSPTQRDAEVFKGMAFENAYSGRETRWIIPKAPTATSPAIWTAGLSALCGARPARTAPKPAASKKTHQASQSPAHAPHSTGLGHRLVMAGGEILLSGRRYDKLRRKPRRFFADSQKPWVRMIGVSVYGADDAQ